MEQQEITVYAAITISGPLVYHLIRWNVYFYTQMPATLVGMIFARIRNEAIRYWPMVTRQAPTMRVGVIPGCCIW
jgi:hypothetical protein